MTGVIYKKMAEIQKAVGAIEKNGKGPSQKGGFAYIKYEDILDKIHALLVENDVIVVPELTYYNHEVKEASNRQNLYARVEAKYTFVAVEDGSSVTVSSVGEGSDIGSDTATRKAATQVMKIAFLHTFTIPNTDDGLLLDNEGEGAGDPKSVTQQAKPGAKVPVKIDAEALSKAQAAVKDLVAKNPDSFAEQTSYVPFGNRLHHPDKNWVTNADKVNQVGKAILEAIAKGEMIE